MLLLQFLLNEVADRERKRILIDAILTISTISAAEACRKTGVQPANLSRFRKEGGEKQVSEELQDRLLVALGWEGGVPNLNLEHEWRIKDRQGLIALEWVLKNRVGADVKLERMRSPGQGQQRSLDSRWKGNLVEGGAPCTILIRSDLSLPSGQLADDLVSELTDIEKRALIAADIESNERFMGKVSAATLRSILSGELSKGLIHLKGGSFLEASVNLGMPIELLEKVAYDWTCRMAREAPEVLSERLSKIDSLRLLNEEFSPSSMTKDQLHLLVQRLACNLQSDK